MTLDTPVHETFATTTVPRTTNSASQDLTANAGLAFTASSWTSSRSSPSLGDPSHQMREHDGISQSETMELGDHHLPAQLHDDRCHMTDAHMASDPSTNQSSGASQKVQVIDLNLAPTPNTNSFQTQFDIQSIPLTDLRRFAACWLSSNRKVRSSKGQVL